MADIILELRDICKRYKQQIVLKKVGFSLKKGHIYGFIGLNGAGKTTIMRILAGMTIPNSGEICLFNRSGKKELEEMRKKCGFLIEEPIFYDFMDVRANMKAVQLLKGKEDKNEIEELLELTGLSQDNERRKKMHAFSMGMKQRYGIASALLGKPEFLVLDEPTNGLDVAGVREMRETLLRLKEERGLTMLVSSHVLGELYRIATDFLFIHKGRIIAQMTHEEVSGQFGQEILLVPQEDKMNFVLLILDGLVPGDYYRDTDGIHITSNLVTAGQVEAKMKAQNIPLLTCEKRGTDIEEYFMSLVKRSVDDGESIASGS